MPDADSGQHGERCSPPFYFPFFVCSFCRAACGRNSKDNTDHPHIIDRWERKRDENGRGSTIEAQDGTIGSADNTEHKLGRMTGAKGVVSAVLRCRGMSDRACPGIAHYNYLTSVR